MTLVALASIVGANADADAPIRAVASGAGTTVTTDALATGEGDRDVDEANGATEWDETTDTNGSGLAGSS
jgi:hypothetical protein